LIRSKACNLFALSIKKVNAEDYFIIGLFTGLDAVLDIDRVTLLNNIYFPTHVKEELMFFDKKEKSTLALVIAYERGQFLSSKVINKLDKAYWEATVWADDLMQSIMSK
jgi:EAL and modified HD-GYP domain-containing signal transduction protein